MDAIVEPVAQYMHHGVAVELVYYIIIVDTDDDELNFRSRDTPSPTFLSSPLI